MEATGSTGETRLDMCSRTSKVRVQLLLVNARHVKQVPGVSCPRSGWTPQRLRSEAESVAPARQSKGSSSCSVTTVPSLTITSASWFAVWS
jgi:hypothetical protein